MTMTPEEQKEAEANGTSVLKEVKSSEAQSDSSSEDIPPFQKRSKRRECIFISIAVVLGAGLIAILVYFSVTNAMAEDPKAVPSNAQNLDVTTEAYDSSTQDYFYDYGSIDSAGGPGNLGLKSYQKANCSGSPDEVVPELIGLESGLGSRLPPLGENNLRRGLPVATTEVLRGGSGPILRGGPMLGTPTTTTVLRGGSGPILRGGPMLGTPTTTTVPRGGNGPLLRGGPMLGAPTTTTGVPLPRGGNGPLLRGGPVFQAPTTTTTVPRGGSGSLLRGGPMLGAPITTTAAPAPELRSGPGTLLRSMGNLSDAYSQDRGIHWLWHPDDSLPNMDEMEPTTTTVPPPVAA